MPFSIVALNGSEPGLVHRLTDNRRCTVGSGPNCTLQLDDPSVAELHARLIFEGGCWRLQDCGSPDGTRLNSEPIRDAPLHHGDLISIGHQWIVFSEEHRPIKHPNTTLQACRIFGRKSLLDRNAPHESSESAERLLRDLAQLASDIVRAETLDDVAACALARIQRALSPRAVRMTTTGFAEPDVPSANCPGATVMPANSLATWVVRRGELLVMELSRSALHSDESSEADPISVDDQMAIVGVPVVGSEGAEACLECRFESANAVTPASLDYLVAAASLVASGRDRFVRAAASHSRPGGSTMDAIPSAANTLAPAVRKSRRALVNATPKPSRIFGDSAVIRRLRKLIEKVAPSDANVLVLGESGTGKELVAESIHEQSHRARHPFVAVNCAAFTESLLESELFGHEKGAFTGAESRRIGQFERADQGTIFLDEVGELSSGCQAKLLRLLEGQPFHRVGGVEPIQVDVRIIAATHRDLPKMVAEGGFREDLWYRLRVIELRSPALRERGDDVLKLAAHFLSAACEQWKGGPQSLTASAAARLQEHHWPGNVRELKNAIERAVVMSNYDEVQPSDLGLTEHTSLDAGEQRMETLAENEGRHIQSVLEMVDGNKTEACKVLGISRATLYSKLARSKERRSAK